MKIMFCWIRGKSITDLRTWITAEHIEWGLILCPKIIMLELTRNTRTKNQGFMNILKVSFSSSFHFILEYERWLGVETSRYWVYRHSHVNLDLSKGKVHIWYKWLFVLKRYIGKWNLTGCKMYNFHSLLCLHVWFL